MLKEGRHRAFRNLPVGWLTHSIHGRDRTEMMFHVINEIVLWSIVYCVCVLMMNEIGSVVVFVVSFMIVHSVMWIIDGNFHVYLLDSFLCVRNSGIDNVVKFIVWASERLEKTSAVSCVLIYGSFCRGMFQGRSDLDLRVVRSKNKSVISTIFLLYVAVWVRFVSLVKGIPTDLQVVDSLGFLDRQMRSDEKPVIVFCSNGVDIHNRGYLFSEIIEDLSLATKKDCSH